MWIQKLCPKKEKWQNSGCLKKKGGAMNKDSFQLGTKVRHKEDKRTGVVVFDFFRCCGLNEIPVEWDGQIGIEGTNWKVLEILEVIEPKVNFEKCRDCIFYNGRCMRYTPGRIAMLYNETKGKRIPERIYPHCQSP